MNNKKIHYCCNCGKTGHLYRKCLSPIISLGVILVKLEKDTLKYLLSKSPIKCDEVMFKIFGLSLAGWNALASFFVFLLTSILLFYKR